MKPKIVNNLTKKDVAKLLKKTGFITFKDESYWYIPSDYGDKFYGNCIDLGIKYLNYSIDYKIREDDSGCYINMIMDNEARIPYKMIPQEMLEDLISRVWQLYIEAQKDLKIAKTVLKLKKAQKDFV